jgi:hypothetical protein
MSFNSTLTEPNEAAVQAMRLLQQSTIGAKPSTPTYYICVADAKNAERRHTADSSLVPFGFPVEFCIHALKESKDNVQDSMSWLEKNAPKHVK